jgi:dTDP-L-rhamnose 4-epimerase
MRVLVTGGLGFVGSRIVEQLLDGGHEAVVVDSIEPTAHRERPRLDERAEQREHSVCDLDRMREAVLGCDAVCHQAAKVGLGVDFSDVDGYVHHNDLGTAVLLRALHERSFAGRYVFASSMVVYGEGAYACERHGPIRPGPRDPDALAAGRFDPPCPLCGRTLTSMSIPEDASLVPRNVYAATKLHQEHLAEAFVLEHPAVTATALRYHNVYGPAMPRDTPYAGVASIFRSALARGESPRVFEDGGQRRDFVHVVDVARANVLALTGPEPVRGPLNIASGTPHTILEMAEALAGAAGSGAPRPRVAGGWRNGDVRHVVASPDRARRTLGFHAMIDFETGMQELSTAELRA